MSPINDLLQEIDQRWKSDKEGRIAVRIIGSSALMMQTNYQRGTKDSDVLETSSLTNEIKTQLLALAGPDTDLSRRHKIYIEIVSRGIPFLPRAPLYRDLKPLNAKLRHFEFAVLDVVDVVVSKLKPFRPNDISDIRAMIDLNLVDPAKLVERFRSAVDGFSCDARAEDLPKYVKHLHRVERDILFVPESQIELPDWIG